MSGIAKSSSRSQSNDGFFDIKFFENGVYLIVYPPEGNGNKVEVKDVIDRLVRKQVKNFNKDVIEYTVKKSDKIPALIAPSQAEAKLDATASVTISHDKMKAYVTLTAPEGGQPLSYDQLMVLLKGSSIIHGINKTNLETIAKYPVYNEPVCIAEGTTPKPGQNGKIEFYFDTSSDHKPAILDDGRVDYRELNIIKNVRKGEVLCKLLPPLQGIPGQTVVGSLIQAANGKQAVLPRGRNVEVTEDGQSLISTIDGQIEYIDGKINVFSNYEVPADVDNTTGNINFVGNVTIRGNVLSGFSVDAGGNVEVLGVVEGATIRAGGDIILRRGMQGLGKGILISGGDIIARYIEYSNIDAKNDIKSEAIMHSNIKCGSKLELSGRKGLLVGGSSKVGREITAKVIGSHMATATDIEVGVDPNVRERYKSIKDEISSNESDSKKTEQAINILKKLEAAGALSSEKQEMLVKSVRTKVYLSQRMNELREEMAQLEAKMQQDANGKIRVNNFMYPGTKIAMGSSLMFVKETLQYCTLYRDGADIRIGPIDK